MRGGRGVTFPIGNLPGDWVRDAVCPSYPDVDFFSAKGRHVSEAKAVCAQCPVTAECLAYSQQAPVCVEGVWGGLSPSERRALRTAAAA